MWVAEGPGDGQVTVEADGAQVEDGGRAQPDVEREPDRAPVATERPEPQHLQRNVKLFPSASANSSEIMHGTKISFYEYLLNTINIF